MIEKREASRRSWQQVGTTRDTRFTVDSLVEGQGYLFQVCAENEYGLSEPAQTTQATTPAGQFGMSAATLLYPFYAQQTAADSVSAVTDVPSVPSTPVISNLTASSVDLSWRAPASDSGAPVLGYLIERQTNDSGKWNRITRSPITTTSYSVPELLEGTKYQFRVLAVNKKGESEPSQPCQPVVCEPQHCKH